LFLLRSTTPWPAGLTVFDAPTAPPQGRPVRNLNGHRKFRLVPRTSSKLVAQICSDRPAAVLVNVDSRHRGGTQVNTHGKASSATNGARDNTARHRFIVLAPDLSIAKKPRRQFLPGTDGATYTITVSNAGPGDTAGAVHLRKYRRQVSPWDSACGHGWSCNVDYSFVLRAVMRCFGRELSARAVTVQPSAL